MAGIDCPQCGASTPLPDDLRVPTFACRYCNTELSTEQYAGPGAVRVEEMRAYLEAIVETPSTVSTATAPKLVHGEGGARDAACAHCGAPITVPLTITVPTVRCDACGKTEPVNRYVSDAERLQLDMARQIAGNQAVAELLHTGVTCPRCGAHNALSAPVPVQMACASCRHAILLSDFVPADAIDRARLKESVLALKEGLARKQRASSRVAGYVVGAVVIVIVLLALAAALLARP